MATWTNTLIAAEVVNPRTIVRIEPSRWDFSHLGRVFDEQLPVLESHCYTITSSLTSLTSDQALPIEDVALALNGSQTGLLLFAGHGDMGVVFVECFERCAIVTATSAIVLLVANDATRATPSEVRQDTWAALLYSDLVVRGRVQSFVVTRENVNAAMPMWPSSNQSATIAVGRVDMLIEEVLRGDAPGPSIQFVVYVSVSGVKDNYAPGQELVCGLMWDPKVLGGMYWLVSDGGRYELTPSGWVRQEGDQTLKDLSELKQALESRAPRNVLADADAIVTGTVAVDDLEYRVAPDGARYAVLHYGIVDPVVLKGDVPEGALSIQVVTSGDYWPAWRDDTTYPQGIERGKKYCFFLRRIDGGGFTVLRGVSGAYEVRGVDLLLPGRQKKVGLTLDDIEESVQSGQ